MSRTRHDQDIDIRREDPDWAGKVLEAMKSATSSGAASSLDAAKKRVHRAAAATAIAVATANGLAGCPIHRAGMMPNSYGCCLRLNTLIGDPSPDSQG